jgi:CRP/FNR family cyclic AMP-dependent transcriptional regulator
MNGSTETILRKTPLSASLTDNEMQALAARATRKRFQKGEELFAEGDPCAGLYLVAAGKVRIFKLSPSGREQILAVEGPGTWLALALNKAADGQESEVLMRIPHKV